MASQMALLFAQRLQVPVVMTDLDQARVDKGLATRTPRSTRWPQRGRLNGDKANRLKALITGSVTKDAFADADFVMRPCSRT